MQSRHNQKSSIGHCIFAVAAIAFLSIPIATAEAGKDFGPAGACDRLETGSAGWSGCIGPADARLADEDLFYAGYWLARLGRYTEAIAYLSQARSPDARTLTYLGFATRKSGNLDGAFPFYRKALALDPDFVVARAYLGEAYLATGNVVAAKSELAEIARRCGVNCAAYDDLARHIAKQT